MNLCYQLGKCSLHSYIQLHHLQSLIRNNSPEFQESNFMNFSPTIKTYHSPESGGSYISRYCSISSHIKLTLLLEETVQYYLIYLTALMPNFMAYSSYITSKSYQPDSLISSVDQARKRF